MADPSSPRRPSGAAAPTLPDLGGGDHHHDEPEWRTVDAAASARRPARGPDGAQVSPLTRSARSDGSDDPAPAGDRGGLGARDRQRHGLDPRDDDPLDPLDAFRPLPPRGASERWHDLVARLAVRPGRLVPAIGGVALAAAVGWWLLRPPAAPIEATLPIAGTESAAPAAGGSGGTGSAPAAAGGTTAQAAGGGAVGSTVVGDPGAVPEAAEVVVQAAGAVARPGVYRLAADARIDDLVREAGGLTADADPDRVNLAAPLVDGQRVWLPRRGDWAEPEVVAGGGSEGTGGSGSGSGSTDAGGSSAGDAPPEVVDLNTATAEQLDTLPGVGPSTATAILAYRDEHGPFAAVDDLLEVRGIGDAKLEQLRPLVTV